MTEDECVKEYLSEYNLKIGEYIQDLRNKRSRMDMENGLEAIINEGGPEDDLGMDPRQYLQNYNQLASLAQDIPPSIGSKQKKNGSILYDESPI